MWWAAQLNQRMIVQISHPLSKTNLQIQKNMYKKLCVGDMWVLGTFGSGGHMGVGDMWVLGTSGCWGQVGVGDMWVLGTSGCRGHFLMDNWKWLTTNNVSIENVGTDSVFLLKMSCNVALHRGALVTVEIGLAIDHWSAKNWCRHKKSFVRRKRVMVKFR